KDHRFYKFTGLAPVDGITAQDQRNEFARRLREQFGIPEVKTDDWGQLFTFLAREVQFGRVILFLDEISWMASIEHELKRTERRFQLLLDQLGKSLCSSSEVVLCP